MLKPRQIEAFRNVMLTGGITSAARMMNVSQPAVSRLIRELEDTLGLSLFERDGLKIRPTQQGSTMFLEVDKYYVGLDRVLQCALDLRERQMSSLRICTIPTLAAGYLPRFLSGFCAERSDLSLSLIALPSAQIAEWIASDQADVGFASMPIADPRLAVHRLPPLAVVAALPAGHRLADRETLRPADFEGEPFLSPGPGTLLRLKIDAMFAQHGVRRVTRIESYVSASICSMVAAGAGLSLIDPFSAVEFEDRNIALRLFEPRVEAEFVVVHQRRAHPPELVQRLIDEFYDHALALSTLFV